jgi:DNA-binding transcriptional regulator YhcF (GntR family)
VIKFYLDSRAGIAPYLQLISQVRRAILLGFLEEGDQLPTVKAVVASLAINPNTVSKAYRELEYQGLVTARSGVGTFVAHSIESASVSSHRSLHDEFTASIGGARDAGLSDETIEAIFGDCLHSNVEASGS